MGELFLLEFSSYITFFQLHRGDIMTAVMFVGTSEHLHFYALPGPEIRPNEMKADCRFIFLRPSKLKQMLQ
jgi:hypothetical protein